MAASSQQILREYLLSLGFKIDQSSSSKFDKALLGFDLNVGSLAKRLLAAGVAAQAMVAIFARSMEKLYYASQRTETTVANIQALEYAAGQAGVSGDAMRGALEGMARALRSNPGLVGFLKDLHVPVEGRQTSEMLLDLVEALGKMPFYQASQIGSMFGINPDDLLMLIQAGPKMKEMLELRKKMAEDAGLDVDAAAKVAMEYDHQLRTVRELFGILKDTAMIKLVGPFNEVAAVVKQVLIDWTKIVKGFTDIPDFFKRLMEGATGHVPGRVRLRADAQARIAAGALGESFGARQAPSGDVGDPSIDLFQRLEQKYGLPPGLLDKMWAKESNRGQNMRSPKGALGHFQFMPKTAADVGLEDPFNLEESATKAAEYMAMLMQKYGGDLQKSLAAYNWGMGNVDKKGLAAAPWETQDYMKMGAGVPVSINQNNTFTITAPDPNTAATKVAQAVDKTWADITRNVGSPPR